MLGDAKVPYVSESQRRLFRAKEARGEISPKTVKEFDKESKGLDLPEYVKKWRGGYTRGGRISRYAEGGPVEKTHIIIAMPEPISFARALKERRNGR